MFGLKYIFQLEEVNDDGNNGDDISLERVEQSQQQSHQQGTLMSLNI